MNYIELEKDIEKKLKTLKESLEKEIRNEIKKINSINDFNCVLNNGSFSLNYNNKENETIILFDFGNKIEQYMLNDFRNNKFYINSNNTTIKNNIKKNLNNILKLVEKYQKYFKNIDFNTEKPEIYYYIEPKFKFEVTNPVYLDLITKNFRSLIRLLETEHKLKDILDLTEQKNTKKNYYFINKNTKKVILEKLIDNKIIQDNMTSEDLKFDIIYNFNGYTYSKKYFKNFIEDFNFLLMNANSNNRIKILEKIIKENNFNYLVKFVDEFFSLKELNTFLEEYKDFPIYENLKKTRVFFTVKNIKTDNYFNFEIDKESLEVKLLDYDKEIDILEQNSENNKLNKINNQIKEKVFEINEFDLI